MLEIRQKINMRHISNRIETISYINSTCLADLKAPRAVGQLNFQGQFVC